MGCQCGKKNDEEIDELKKESLDGINPEEKDNNYNNDVKKKDDVFGSNMEDRNNNEEGNENQVKTRKVNNNNEADEDYIEKINEEKNAKYADYPEKMLEIINKIREDPASYADVIEDSIKNIIEEQDKNDENKTKLIYKKKVKVALTRGEPAFREAAEKLRNMEPLPPLELDSNICIPLPETVEEIKDPSFLKEQVKILRETTNIDIFFKDLIKLPEVSALLMIVDDNIKNPGRKRQAILNKDFKSVGINSHFIGKTFVAYFAFSK
jgi:hypothetical protein